VAQKNLKATTENKTSVTTHFTRASSSSKVQNILCKNCRMWKLL